MNITIQKACDAVGGQTALAKLISTITGKEITQQRVRNWAARGDSVPTEFIAAIEQATDGKVTRKDMRPNDWQTIWPELAAVEHHAEISESEAERNGGMRIPMHTDHVN